MLIQLLSNPVTVVVLSAALILLFLWSAVRFEASIGQLRSLLTPLLAVLKRPKDSRDFAGQFETTISDAQSVVKQDSVLDIEWQICAQGMVLDGGRIIATRQIDDLFQVARVLHRASIMGYRSLPGVLIGFGLVFTFAGISVVISQAGSSLVDAGNIDALHKLLSAAGLKFITSLVGVGLSVVCGLHYRLRTAPVVELLASIRRRIQLLAPQPGHGDLINAVSAVRTDLDIAAKAALSGIVNQASKALTDAVANQMSAVAMPVQKLTKAVDDAAVKFGAVGSQAATCAETLTKAIDVFTIKLSESSESLREDLSKALTDAVANQMSAVAMPVQKLINAVDDAAIKFGAVGSQAVTCAETLTKAIDVFTNKLSESSESLREDFTTVRSHATSTAKDFAKIAAASTIVSGSADKLMTMIAQLEVVLTSLEKLQILPTVLDSATSALGSAAKDLSNIWAAYVHKIEATENQLSRSAEVLPSMFEQYSKALQTYTTDLDGHLAKTTQVLQQWVEHIARLQGSAVSPQNTSSLG